VISRQKQEKTQHFNSFFELSWITEDFKNVFL